MATRLLRLFEFVPVFGWMLRSARLGGYTERLAFVLNLIVLWLLLVAWVGYPVVIVTMLSLTAIYLFGLVYVTSRGLSSGRDWPGSERGRRARAD